MCASSIISSRTLQLTIWEEFCPSCAWHWVFIHVSRSSYQCQISGVDGSGLHFRVLPLSVCLTMSYSVSQLHSWWYVNKLHPLEGHQRDSHIMVLSRFQCHCGYPPMCFMITHQNSSYGISQLSMDVQASSQPHISVTGLFIDQIGGYALRQLISKGNKNDTSEAWHCVMRI